MLIDSSAGGGGNSEARREKIATKNTKLHDERANDRLKRVELETKQAERAAKKGKGKKGAEGEEEEAAAEPDNNGIHPARLAMMAGNGPPPRPSYPNHRQRY